MTPIQKLEAEYVNWNRLPDWVQWVTADGGGTVIAWARDPRRERWWENGNWLADGEFWPLAFRYDMTGINWRDCKWQRPRTNTRT